MRLQDTRISQTSLSASIHFSNFFYRHSPFLVQSNKHAINVNISKLFASDTLRLNLKYNQYRERTYLQGKYRKQ